MDSAPDIERVEDGPRDPKAYLETVRQSVGSGEVDFTGGLSVDRLRGRRVAAEAREYVHDLLGGHPERYDAERTHFLDAFAKEVERLEVATRQGSMVPLSELTDEDRRAVINEFMIDFSEISRTVIGSSGEFSPHGLDHKLTLHLRPEEVVAEWKRYETLPDGQRHNLITALR